MNSYATNPRTTPATLGWSRLPAAYAIPRPRPPSHDARAYCARLARTHYENFSVASWFLPTRLRQHFFNVYAYCRISDDLGDEVGDTAASLELLDQWQRELDACYEGSPETSSIRCAGGHRTAVRHSQARILRSADRLPSGSDRHALRNLRRRARPTAATRRIRSAISCSISADIATPSASIFPTSPARHCNSPISGRMSAVDYAKGRIYLPLEDLRLFNVDRR